MLIKASAPTRVDLAGGTLDLWPVQHLLSAKATVNIGVTLDAQVVVTLSKDDRYHISSQDQNKAIEGSYTSACGTQELPLIGLLLGAIWRAELPPLTIVTSAKSPAGAGLGGSSCLAVTIAGALLAARRTFEDVPEKSDHQLVQLVQDVEARLIHAPTGCQDYWGALRGRINVLRFPFGGPTIETLAPETLPTLNDHLILCYSGKSRASALNNWEIFKHVFDGDLVLKQRLEEIGTLAEACAAAVTSGDVTRALEISQQEWQCRTRLWPSIETKETKTLDQAARKAGAQFTRVCGAGGGGVMAVIADPDHHRNVTRALVDNGGIVLNADIAKQGLTIT